VSVSLACLGPCGSPRAHNTSHCQVHVQLTRRSSESYVHKLLGAISVEPGGGSRESWSVLPSIEAGGCGGERGIKPYVPLCEKELPRQIKLRMAAIVAIITPSRTAQAGVYY
jgi:hypothetical protein